MIIFEMIVENIVFIGLVASLVLLVRARKATEDLTLKLEDLQSQCRVSIKEKTTFLATASHDLQQPHQAVGLFLESLNMQDLDLENKRIINKAKDAHATTTRLMNQLLDISRLDTIETANTKLISLHDLVHNIGMKFMPIAACYGVELRIWHRDAWAVTDPVMLERMITNILLNAFRHAKKANVLLAIRNKTIDGVKHWRIEIYDTGLGIPKDKQPLIFKEFTKLSKPEASPTGLGLGLSIVKRLGEILKHPVGLRSRLGYGSCFHISLPQAKPKVKVLSRPVVDSVIRQRMKVIVVHENAALRDSLKSLLTAWGCKVKTCKSSRLALQLVREESWLAEALIIDGALRNTQLNLSDIEDIRGLTGQSIPMILITKDTQSTFASEAKKVGFTLIANPIESSALRQVLGNR